MRKKNYKGRCEKRSIPKCPEVCRTYDPIQAAFAQKLGEDDSITEFQCNVLMEGLDIGDYTADFVCKRTDGANYKKTGSKTK